MNENYINYIQSNPKLVQTVDDLAEADTGTTGHYLILDFPCDNKQQDVHLLPIKMPNGKKSRQQPHHSFLTKTCQFNHGKHIFFQSSIMP